MHGLEISRFATERLDQFGGGTQAGERIEGKYFNVFDALDPGISVLVEQAVEDGAGLFAVFGEYVFLLDLFGALFPGQRRAVESDVADQVKRVEGLPCFLPTSSARASSRMP